MPTVTNIRYKESKGRYWVFIDGEYCTSIRERTFPAMNISIGKEITCEQLKELESFHWKKQYGKPAWEREQVRLARIVEIIEKANERVKVNIVGFGAGSSEFIASHPEESGKPDLDVVKRSDETVSVMSIEVTGTETRRGTDYWIRPDKLTYCQNNPEEDVWIVLHYQNPTELVVFIKPNQVKSYVPREIEIRGSIEYYVIFNDSSPELKTMDEFCEHLAQRIKGV